LGSGIDLQLRHLQEVCSHCFLLRSGQPQPSSKCLQVVLGEQPDFADARYELGKALLQKGDVKGSIENLETAPRLKPDQPHIHYQLGRAYIAAGRKSEGEGQLEISKQLKEKARAKN